MKSKRLPIIIFAVIVVGIVVASAVLIIARRNLWAPATMTYTVTTPREQYEELSGPQGEAKSILDEYCGKSHNLIVIFYLKNKPNATYVNMVKTLFTRILSRYAKLSGEISTCLISSSKATPILNKLSIYSYPVVALALRGMVSKDLLKVFNNVDGLLVSSRDLHYYLLSQISQYIMYEDIPVETEVQPSLIGGVPVIGSKNAKVYLYIYEDVHCPFCAWFYNETLPKLMPLVRKGVLAIVLKNFIVHPESLKIQEYIEAAYMATHNSEAVLKIMEKIYSRVYDLCFVKKRCEEVPKLINASYVLGLIKAITGLSIDDLNKYLNKSKEEINRDSREALSYGISGTPGFVIWDKVSRYGLVVVGMHSPSSMSKLIEYVNRGGESL